MEETEKKKPAGFNISIAIVLLAVGCYVITFLVNTYLAQRMSKSLFGDFSLALNLFLAGASLFLFGTDAVSQKFLAPFLQENRLDKASDFIAWNFKLILRICFIYFILVTVFFVILIGLHWFGVHLLSEHHVAIYILFFIPIGAVAVLLANYLLATQNILWSQFLLEAAHYIFFFLFALLLVSFEFETLGETQIVFIICVSFLCLAILNTILVSLLISPILLQGILKRFQVPYTPNKEWLGYSASLCLSLMLYNITDLLALLVIEALPLHEHEVAHYSVILLIIGFFWLVSNSLEKTITPQFVYLHSNGLRRLLQKRLSKVNFTLLTLNTLLLVAILFFGHELLSLFGKGFNLNYVYNALVLGGVGACIDSLTVISLSLVTYVHSPKIAQKFLIFEIVAVLSLGLIATYFFSIVGLSVSYIFIALCKWGYVLKIQRKVGYRYI